MNQNSDYQVVIQSSSRDDGRSIIVQAPMPESFVFDSSSNFEAPFAQGLFSANILKLGAAAMGYRSAVQAMTVQLWQGTNDTELGLELEFQTETNPMLDVRKPILDLLKLTVPIVDPATGLMQSPGPHLDPNAQEALQTGADAVASLKDTALSAGRAFVESVGAKIGVLNNTSKSSNDGNNNNNKQPPNLGSAAYWKSRIKNPVSIRIGNYMYFDLVVITNVHQTYVSNIDKLTGFPHHVKVAVRFKPLFMITQQDLDNIFITPKQGSPTGDLISVAKKGFTTALGLFS